RERRDLGDRHRLHRADHAAAGRPGRCPRRRGPGRTGADQVHTRTVRRARPGRGPALRHQRRRHPGALLRDLREGRRGQGHRWSRPDPAVRLRRLRDLLDPRLPGSDRQGVAGARRNLCAGQHPRRRRVRAPLAPGGAEGEPAPRLRGLLLRRPRPHRARCHRPRPPAVRGGSNGGLLTGNMVTRYPEMFEAVVIQVPLLDMKRYSHLLAGYSWMAEFGDPDTEDWEFIRTFSPYHLLREDPDQPYPPTFLLTSTRDDRVHPGHARKFAAAMESLGA